MTTEPAPEGKAMPAERKLTPVNYQHSANFLGMLEQFGISLLISTYQAGKVLTVGRHDGAISITFHNFEQAMGLAVSPDCLAVGSKRQIWMLKNGGELANRMSPAGKYDLCYLTRTAHFTGPVHGHEMAWSGDRLWFVNTLFSCLCTVDDQYSFVPRWRPPFISALAAEDRCHLNGMAMDAGSPRYATAMAETDVARGWRPDKATTGVVIDVQSGETVARGFAMPHSPRLHNGRLWVLNSGLGNISRVDPATGQIEQVAAVPGYTRGLAFHGPYAFVGLSKIRETSVFNGVPIAEHRERLQCGIQVIDVRNGQIVASLAFDSGVDEIFDVKVLPGIRCPKLSGPLPDVDGGEHVWLASENPPTRLVPPGNPGVS